MQYKRIIVIIPPEAVAPMEARLKQLRVGGLTLSKVQGYGEYKNLFSQDWMSEHAKIEIFCEATRSDEIVDALAEMVHDGPPGAGIAAVVPDERFVHLRAAPEQSAS